MGCLSSNQKKKVIDVDELEKPAEKMIKLHSSQNAQGLNEESTEFQF